MFRRYWFAALALGLALAVPAVGQGQAENDGSRAEQTAAQGVEDGQSTPFAIPVRVVQPGVQQEAREHLQEEARAREERDVLAQEGMETATDRMAQLAFWQTVFVGIGTLLVAGTLYLMVQANRAAIRAAEAANKTAEITRDIGEKQVRAYLSIESVAARITKYGITPEIKIHNSGNSPAKAVQCVVNVGVRSNGGYKRSDYMTLNWSAIAGQVRVEENDTCTASQTLKEVAADRMIWVWVHGCLFYRDVFGVEERVPFAFNGNWRHGNEVQISRSLSPGRTDFINCDRFAEYR